MVVVVEVLATANPMANTIAKKVHDLYLEEHVVWWENVVW